MSPAEAVLQRFEARNRGTGRAKFFKADHPRAIDLYIDYFGGLLAVNAAPAENDLCGETALEALSSRRKPFKSE